MKRSLQLREHRFRHHPQCPVKFHVPVNTANGTGMRPSSFGITPTETALNQVLLNTLVRGPQVIALILPAAGRVSAIQSPAGGLHQSGM
jgi:hypothetical protein